MSVTLAPDDRHFFNLAKDKKLNLDAIDESQLLCIRNYEQAKKKHDG